LKIADLRQALAKAETIAAKLRSEYPQLKFKIVASLGYGVASIEMSNLEFFRKAGSIFVKSEDRIECSLLLAQLEHTEKQKDYHKGKFNTVNQIRNICETRIDFLVSSMAIDENVKIEFQLDKIDPDLINWLQGKTKIYIGYGPKNYFATSRVHIGCAIDLLRLP